MTVPVLDHAGLTAAERAALEQALGQLTTLERALHWMRDFNPRVRVEEILTQDEYTHDVVIPVPGGRYLAFDTS